MKSTYLLSQIDEIKSRLDIIQHNIEQLKALKAQSNSNFILEMIDGNRGSQISEFGEIYSLLRDKEEQYEDLIKLERK